MSGATGGFDVLQTATLMGGAEAEFFNEKGPDALRSTPVYDDTLQTERRTVFGGTASEAIKLFPTKVNVTVAAARASVGPNALNVKIQSTPGFKGDTQRVEIRNSQVRAVIDVYSATAEIAAWSVVSTLRNIASPVWCLCRKQAIFSRSYKEFSWELQGVFLGVTRSFLGSYKEFSWELQGVRGSYKELEDISIVAT